MAQDTPKSLRGQIIYCVFTRNYSKEGTFEAVRQDLDRIQALGTDIIWLMPIQPSGKVHRKGSSGSPYAIQDYRRIDPAQGTMEDFKRLVDDIHAHGMKCIIDIVYHHTSPDSWLAVHHPEWFYHKPDGSFGNQVGDWWDVIDLDYTQKGLWDYQIETLKMWAEYVDGFRCDVGSMVPMEFWKKARAEVAKVRKNAVWLDESVEGNFIVFNRTQGIYCASDAEAYEAFDLCYEYDITDDRDAFLKGEGTLAHYFERLNLQEELFPDNYDKLRCLENHDRRRIHELIPDERQLLNWTAFLYLEKGTVLLYNGQEKGCTEQPSLFDPDPIAWTEHGENGEDLDLTNFLKGLAEIKKNVIPTDATFHAMALPGDIGIVTQTENGKTGEPGNPVTKSHRKTILGIFALGPKMPDEENVPARIDEIPENSGDKVSEEQGHHFLPDGGYVNLITGKSVKVNGGKVPVSSLPLIFVIV